MQILADTKTVVKHYNEYVDTSSRGDDLRGKPWPDCAKWTLPGECENGHWWTKVLLCGQEWCRTCGENWSWIHRRRFARWVAKAQQMDIMGYWVIEWPLASRDKLHTKGALSAMGKRVKGAFQALGYDRGLRRWHFFGETGDVYNPHINVLVDGRYLKGERLESVKAFLRHVLGEPDLIVNYHYRRAPAAKVHTLKYVLRATFLDEAWDEELARELHNFQNTNYWGKWEGEMKWELKRQDDGEITKVKQLEHSICPDCGKPIKWGQATPIDWLDIWGGEEVGAGYYRLPARSPPLNLSRG